MAIHEYDPLSIWELALRWCGFDPDSALPRELPLACRDLIRDLCLAGLGHINPLNVSGEEYLNSYIPFSTFVVESKVLKTLQAAANQRIFDPKFLDSVYFGKDQVAKWCIMKRRAFPHFWFRTDDTEYFLEQWEEQRGKYPYEWSPGYPAKQIQAVDSPSAGLSGGNPSPSVGRKPTASQRDKLAVQAAAKLLWHQFPDMTIADLIKRREIDKDCNGAQYQLKTVRGWVSEVDPRNPLKKSGRPKKKQTLSADNPPQKNSTSKRKKDIS